MVWTKGVSGNPGGRAKEKPFRDALRLELAAAGDDHKALRRVAQALLEKAAAGDTSAIALLADRLDGKVPQAIGGSEDLGPQRLHISWKQGPQSDDRRAIEVEASEVLAITAPVAQQDDSQRISEVCNGATKPS
jgi:hypothetical protein